jgi:hypothetical protein
MAFGRQQFADMAADEARAAGHQNVQGSCNP